MLAWLLAVVAGSLSYSGVFTFTGIAAIDSILVVGILYFCFRRYRVFASELVQQRPG